MDFYVLSIQKKKYNKTVRYLEKRGFEYQVLIPDCIDNEIVKSYGKKAVVYDTEICKSYVDFCGTNIQNGAAVGRVASIFEAKKNKGISICLDDDYAGVAASKPINTYKKDALELVIQNLYELTKETGVVFGGYSGGAMPKTKNNIMQIWIMDSDWNLTDLNMILNEDVNFSIKKNKTKEKVVKFLFIGGMNAFSRKHILKICEGFTQAYDKNKNIRLTCTIQKTNLLEENDKNKINTYFNNPGINIIQNHLTYSDIINLYHNHHVSIQVSKHEGLGLGFYESVATGTPVISLNTPPHNEIILDGINGWIIDSTEEPMVDNKDPIFNSASFDPSDLQKKILQIAQEFNSNYDKIINSLLVDYSTRLHISKFEDLFLEGINN